MPRRLIPDNVSLILGYSALVYLCELATQSMLVDATAIARLHLIILRLATVVKTTYV